MAATVAFRASRDIAANTERIHEIFAKHPPRYLISAKVMSARGRVVRATIWAYEKNTASLIHAVAKFVTGDYFVSITISN